MLLLAPTGKARVQMERGIGLTAQTIAQFLLPLDRYEPNAAVYRTSDSAPADRYATVIIDECSMLTEEQLAAVLDGLRGVGRLILVGDSRQLPPIGSGRPFVDLVSRLRPRADQLGFPRVADGYCELTVLRRQEGARRHDLLLAEWFTGERPSPGSDEIWEALRTAKDSSTLQLFPGPTQTTCATAPRGSRRPAGAFER